MQLSLPFPVFCVVARRILRHSSEESRVFQTFSFLFPFRRCCCQLIVGQWVRIIGLLQISAKCFLKKFTVRLKPQQYVQKTGHTTNRYHSILENFVANSLTLFQSVYSISFVGSVSPLVIFIISWIITLSIHFITWVKKRACKKHLLI